MTGKNGKVRDRLTLEAELKPAKGKEWAVTIMGASGPDSVLEVGGERYIVSSNGRLYSTKALAASAPMWEGVKVYDDHLTDDEYQARHGMRSTLNEWVGVIVNPHWDEAANKLRATLKIVEDRLAAKLKNAWEAGVLGAIGLSADTFTKVGREIVHEGRRLPAIEGFKAIVSVDVVGNPAAGGAFERLLAAHQEEMTMAEESNGGAQYVTKEDFDAAISRLEDALTAKAEEAAKDIDELTDDEVRDALDDKDLTEKQIEAQKAQIAARKARHEADVARTELAVTRALERARLPEKFEEVIWAQFRGQVAEREAIDAAIKRVKEAHASLDPTGRVRAGGNHRIEVGLGDEDRFSLLVLNKLMGDHDFRGLEHNESDLVQERVKEANAFGSWISAGKPDLPYYGKLSHLLADYYGGDIFLNPHLLEAATTSTLTTAVKNALNVILANEYSKREEWWAPIVTTEEVDSIDQATLARLYGVDSLSVVNEGAAYTELAVSDEEETASFVKRGNYIGVTLELLMNDKIGAVRRIPMALANAWYNTQSDLVANVFTVNSNTGPVLADTGALFNATAATSAGGHANLLTTALSHSQFGTVRTAMMKQTDQALGAGRRLLLQPRYLLVPVDLETTALEIRNAEMVPGADFDSAGGGAQTPNLYRGSFEVIVVPNWTDADDWAVVADPAVAPAIHLIYPRGQRTPQIFSAESETGGAMFTNDELRFKVRLMTYRYSATYDCAPVSDFRPLHKSNV